MDKLQNQSLGMGKQMKKTSHFKCELCKDIGYIIKPQINVQSLMTTCKWLETERVKRLWRNSGINTDNLDKSFNNFEEWSSKSREMKFKATDYYKSFGSISAERRNGKGESRMS